MTACLSIADLSVTAVGTAFVTSLVAGAVGHGVLQPLLEGRGIRPWRLRDSLGAMPLTIVGSGLAGGSAAAAVGWLLTACAIDREVAVLVSVVFLAGVLSMRLGLLALRKLV